MVDLLKAPQEALQSLLGRKNAPQYATRLFQLRDIPTVMRSRLGWPVAAALMERWFNGAAYQMTPQVKGSVAGQRLSHLPSTQLDENTVSMAWASTSCRTRIFANGEGKNDRGGDFMVLSNVHRIRLAFPLKFQW